MKVYEAQQQAESDAKAKAVGKVHALCQLRISAKDEHVFAHMYPRISVHDMNYA